MLEMFKEIDWGDYVELLSYGTPPVYLQLLILIIGTIAWFLYRTIKRVRRMSKGNVVKYKILFVVVFFLILFQEKFDVRGWMDMIGL